MNDDKPVLIDISNDEPVRVLRMSPAVPALVAMAAMMDMPRGMTVRSGERRHISLHVPDFPKQTETEKTAALSAAEEKRRRKAARRLAVIGGSHE